MSVEAADHVDRIYAAAAAALGRSTVELRGLAVNIFASVLFHTMKAPVGRGVWTLSRLGGPGGFDVEVNVPRETPFARPPSPRTINAAAKIAACLNRETWVSTGRVWDLMRREQMGYSHMQQSIRLLRLTGQVESRRKSGGDGGEKEHRLTSAVVMTSCVVP